MERVAGGHVGRHLSLEAVDVAAVAEQVALQRVAAVALLVIQHQAAVLWDRETWVAFLSVLPEAPAGTGPHAALNAGCGLGRNQENHQQWSDSASFKEISGS